MDAIVFNGQEFSGKIEDTIRQRVSGLRHNGKTVTVVSYYLATDPGSQLYTKLKTKKAEELGVNYISVPVSPEENIGQLIADIQTQSSNPDIAGILIQHPQFADNIITTNWKELVGAIDVMKDIDGLREDSVFVAATVKAVQRILDYAVVILSFPKDAYVTIVGCKGLVGSKLLKELPHDGFHVRGADIGDDIARMAYESEIIISVTGKPNLITGDMVYQGAIVIDVGSPKGDVDFDSAKTKASFITPVPGGVGPVTVACLLDNAVLSAQHAHNIK